MKFATWNINSVRARQDRLLAFLERSDVDVLAVQETKATDEQFPTAALAALGYDVAHHGFSQWNGVALISRVGIENVRRGFPGMPTFGEPPESEARAIGATCGGIDLWSLYVPNGRGLDDPHYDYKLEWLAALAWFTTGELTADPQQQLALCGDFNIAPQDEDVWDMAAFDGSTHVSAAERTAFGNLLDSGLSDVVRPLLPGPGVYTYWDYQRLRFARREGMRIDFALASAALARRVTGAVIDRQERKGKGASDHAPVIVELA
ncbi:exodeoxyribonuclease III [Nakamurella sp. PAMC28650]|uniref:exodeoxyribonuclease III n=1 Tax=Nakamurella sp. PAMC28650 TaxID=2762325 RepID=UPI00164E18B1|nr:exodeoxyribonuclease III [Nakamurella sp. PAMC28650]QNK79660.1 exodeoxyribonuclease III [Nakamurella sp. PAMC28650]